MTCASPFLLCPRYPTPLPVYQENSPVRVPQKLKPLSRNKKNNDKKYKRYSAHTVFFRYP